MHPFQNADILLPNVGNINAWSVIACDQFVSQPEYWQAVKAVVGDSPSALNLILPEAHLEDDCTGAIERINETMAQYLNSRLFTCYPHSFLYVERTLLNGTVRTGVIGAVDLESYDFRPESTATIRATEQTVAERIPPRMNIRRNAPLELPHVLLLCDDEEKRLVESLTAKKETLPLMYDFDLMLGGGKIRGWLVSGQDATEFEVQLAAYEQRIRAKYGDAPVMYAVGDGNHSLASAKGCYEERKTQGLPCEKSRYALVELENIHDASQVFEPIHRFIKHTKPKQLLAAMEKAIGRETGTPIYWQAGHETGVIHVHSEEGLLPVGIVQNFLDDYLKENPGIMDYIHGEDALNQLSEGVDAIGFLMPPVEKNAFFQGIIAGGTLPRKTFSMGHAQEKRYYLEAREIQ